jgi:hypothetical protein
MARQPLGLAARLAGPVVLLLAVSGCLVADDEFEEAQRRKEVLGAELSKLRLENDQLNREISRLYADREVISAHVAMSAAIALHNQMTAGLRQTPPPAQARPAAAPARPAGQPQAARPPQPTPPPQTAPGLPAFPAGARPPGAVDIQLPRGAD